jgi:hypothetical protein
LLKYGSNKAVFNASLKEAAIVVCCQLIKIKQIFLCIEIWSKSEQKIKCGTNCTEQQDSQNRRSEFLIVKK